MDWPEEKTSGSGGGGGGGGDKCPNGTGKKATRAGSSSVRAVTGVVFGGQRRGETMGTGTDQRTARDSREERLSPAICQVNRRAATRLFRGVLSE